MNRIHPALGACVLVLLAACGSREAGLPPEAGAAVAAQEQAERNKEIALAFFHGVFTEHKPREAFERYSVPDYIQHNPLAADGAEATVAFLEEWLRINPRASAEVKRVIAHGNLVAIHHHMRQSPDVAGLACTEWYRVENGRVVEHWDTAQAMPTESKNPHPMF